MDQKLEFAEQLQAPMHIAGLESRPAVLFNLFNTHNWGRSVTFQAVSRWLRDESIPGQDQLITLVKVLKIEPEVLRFDAARGELRLQVTAPGFTEIERFRELAGKRFEVQQGEVRSTEGKVEGALVLKGRSS